jgi:pimeloyl-ACP methyl ester carboxylesterase
VLAYDRLGTGKSEKPDAYDIVQIPTDIDILVKLTKLARSGTLISSSLVSTNDASAAAIHDYTPTKIVHVGHAYGSYIMFIMLGQYADISDAALMTGLRTQLPCTNCM